MKQVFGASVHWYERPHPSTNGKRRQAPRPHLYTMQAALATAYGSPGVIRITEMSKPVPKPNELLIRIHASAVNSADSRIRRADPWAVRLAFGLSRPKRPILGNAFAGVVESVGSAVSRFKPGDRVFGSPGMRMGCHAEYMCLQEDGAIAPMPADVSWNDAAAIPFGGQTALHFLRKAGVAKGQRVLVYGASGAVGTAAVQLARQLGAEVTAVCSTANLELVRSLGAQHVVDHTKRPLALLPKHYDVVYETVNKLPVKTCAELVNPGGKLVLGAALMTEMLQGAWAGMTGKVKIIAGVAAESAELMNALKAAMEAGALRAVIDRSYPLARIAEAHAHVDGGHKAGNVVVTM